MLNDADRVLDIRDELENKWSAERGRIGRPHWGETVKRPAVAAAGFKDVYAFESRLMDIRTAAYIVLASPPAAAFTSSGMRRSDAYSRRKSTA